MMKNTENVTEVKTTNKGFATGVAVGAIGSLAATVIFEGIMMARSIKRCRDKSEQFAREINETVQKREEELRAEYEK